MQAIALHQQGLSSDEIAATLDRSRRTVEKWITIAETQGVEGLRAKAHAGATPKLNAKQRADLRRRLLAGAKAAGFDTDLWTCPRVRQLIQNLYGVTYHVDYLSCLLRALGFSCQKPQLQARERDPDKVKRWIARDWSRIKKKHAVTTPTSYSSMKAACC
jgi:transposase